MILYFICDISLLSFNKVQRKFGKIFDAYKNLPHQLISWKTLLEEKICFHL